MHMLTPEQSKNFINTFGYLEAALPDKIDYDSFLMDVNRQISEKLSMAWSDICKQKRGYALQAFADNSKVGADFLVNWLDKFIEPILGKNYLYIESDVSVFFEAGSAWHRDAGMRLPVYKFLLYLDYTQNNTCCDFFIIPGSQHIDSVYSAFLQKGLAWPDKYGFAGGLSENEYFPHGSDQTSPCYDHNADPIPHKRITIRKGGAVLFNHTALHSAKSIIPIGKPRRLVTFSFCANPIDLPPDHFCRDPQNKKLDNETLLREIYYTIALQSKRLGVNSYGPELQNYPEFIRKHGVDWSLVRKIVDSELDEYQTESGSKADVQVKKMTNFLLQNIPDVSCKIIN